jgi:predicted nucleotidyltransferase
MTILEEVAADVGVHERTLRRGLADGLLRGRRPTVRTTILAPGEPRYLRAHWPLLSALRTVLRTERNVKLAVLIGSAARGELTDDSDVDLLVQLEDGGWRARDRLRERLRAAVAAPSTF